MKEYDELYEFDLTNDMFHDALQRLKVKHPDKYKFTIKSGKSLKNALFVIFKDV